jgi:PKD repeat protein
MNFTFKKSVLFLIINLIAITAFSQSNNAFRIKITGNGYSDETIIRLLNGATQNFDGSYDAWKFFSPNPNVPSIYTQVSNGQELSINTLPEFTEDKSVTIYTNIPVNGSYTINFEEIYGLTSNYKISLSDISSNTHFRLLGDTALAFNFNAQQNSPSFTFNISTATTTTVIDESCYNMNDGSLLVNNPGNTDWDIEITNAANNIIVNSTSNTNISNYNNLPPGAYTAKVSSKGIIDEVSFTIAPAANLIANFSLNKDTLYVSEGGTLNITNTSQNAQNFSWDFGDGGYSSDINPTYNYSTIGIYDVTLVSSNLNCSEATTKHITVLLSPNVVTSIHGNNTESMSLLSLGNGNYQIISMVSYNKTVVVYDARGSKIYEDRTAENKYQVSLTNQPSGIYIINVVSENGQVIQEKVFR